MTTDLIAFITARLDDDERAARAATDGVGWSRDAYCGRWVAAANGYDRGAVEDETGGIVVFDEGAPNEAQADHIARHDPARVLREVEAKRQLLAECQKAEDASKDAHAAELATRDERGVMAMSAVRATNDAFLELMVCRRMLRSLAAPYADHPDYRQEWAP